MAQKDFAHFFSFEKFNKYLDKCCRKRELLQGIKEEKSMFGKLGKKLDVKKADMKAKVTSSFLFCLVCVYLL